MSTKNTTVVMNLKVLLLAHEEPIAFLSLAINSYLSTYSHHLYIKKYNLWIEGSSLSIHYRCARAFRIF